MEPAPPEQEETATGRGLPRDAQATTAPAMLGETGTSPYLTSGTVTELSAMLVDRMIWQTNKKEQSDSLTRMGRHQAKRK